MPEHDGDDREFEKITVEEQQELIKKEQKREHFNPLRVPRYTDPVHKKLMQSIKNDLMIQKVKADIHGQDDTPVELVPESQFIQQSTVTAAAVDDSTAKSDNTKSVNSKRRHSKLSKEKIRANRTKRDYVTSRLVTSDREHLDVRFSIKRPTGKQVHPITRASLVEKHDVGC